MTLDPSLYDSSFVDPTLLSLMGQMSPGLAFANQQFGAQYGSLRALRPNVNMGFGSFRIPGLGDEVNGMLGMLPMYLAPMFQSQGYTLGSIFGPMNSYSQAMLARQEINYLMGSENVARSMNEQIWEGRVRAYYAATNGGVPSVDPQFIKDVAGTYNQMFKWAVPFTSVLDKALGTDFTGILMPTAGVGMNVGLASLGFYHGAGLYGLAVDPTTGRPVEAERLTEAVIRNFLVQPGDVRNASLNPFGYALQDTNYALTHGLTLPTLAQALPAMQQRHLLGRWVTDLEMSPETRDLMEREALTDPGWARATGGRSLASSEAFREAFNQRRVTRAMEQYSGVLAIGREIVGSKDGEEVLKAVDALTGGGLGNIDPQRLTQMIAEVREIARTARVSMDVMSTIVNEGAAMAKQMGLSSVAGARLASQNVLLSHIATTAVGSISGAQEYAGKPTFESVLGVSQSMSMSGLASQGMKQLGAALHLLSQKYGGPENVVSMQNGQAVVNPDITSPLLREALQGLYGGDISGVSRLLGSAGGYVALAEAVASQTGLPRQTALSALTNNYMAKLGQTEFDMGRFAREAGRGEVVDLMMKFFGPQEYELFKSVAGVNLGNMEQLRGLIGMGVSGNPGLMRENLARLISSNRGMGIDAAMAEAGKLMIPLQTAFGNVLQQFGINPENQYEVGAYFDADQIYKNMMQKIGAYSKDAADKLGVQPENFIRRMSDFVASAQGGGSGDFMKGMMALIGAIPSDEVRRRVTGVATEYQAITTKLKEGGYVTQTEAIAARNRQRVLASLMTEGLPALVGDQATYDAEYARIEGDINKDQTLAEHTKEIAARRADLEAKLKKARSERQSDSAPWGSDAWHKSKAIQEREADIRNLRAQLGDLDKAETAAKPKPQEIKGTLLIEFKDKKIEGQLLNTAAQAATGVP